MELDPEPEHNFSTLDFRRSDPLPDRLPLRLRLLLFRAHGEVGGSLLHRILSGHEIVLGKRLEFEVMLQRRRRVVDESIRLERIGEILEIDQNVGQIYAVFHTAARAALLVVSSEKLSLRGESRETEKVDINFKLKMIKIYNYFMLLISRMLLFTCVNLQFGSSASNHKYFVD